MIRPSCFIHRTACVIVGILYFVFLAPVTDCGFRIAESSAHAAAIGYIDVQRVFKEFRETSKAKEELAKEEETFKKEFDEKQKKLQDAETQKKPKEELEKMKKQLEEELGPKREKLLKLNEQLTTRLQQEILTAVQTVAKQVGIDLVMDKQVVITGGIDLTELTVNKLNQKK